MAKAAGVKIVPVSIGNLHRSVRAFTLYPHILFDFIGLIVRFRHTSGCKNYFFPSQHFSFFSTQFYDFKFHINFTTGTKSFFSSPAIFTFFPHLLLPLPPFIFLLFPPPLPSSSAGICQLHSSYIFSISSFSSLYLLFSSLPLPYFPSPSSSFFSS